MLKKTIAIVTGASGGLGLEFVKILMKKPELDEIWIISRSQEKLEKIQKKLGDKIRCFHMDLSELANIKQFGANQELESCNIKYLINNAGFAKCCS